MMTFFKKQQISYSVLDIYTLISKQTEIVLGKEIYIGDFAVRLKWAAVPVYCRWKHGQGNTLQYRQIVAKEGPLWRDGFCYENP